MEWHVDRKFIHCFVFTVLSSLLVFLVVMIMVVTASMVVGISFSPEILATKDYDNNDDVHDYNDVDHDHHPLHYH